MFAERDAQAAKKRLRERDRKRMLEASEEKATTDRLMVELHRRREASVKACAGLCTDTCQNATIPGFDRAASIVSLYRRITCTMWTGD